MSKYMTIKEFCKERLDTGEYARQFELGIELEISSATLSHYLCNQAKQPKLETAQLIFQKYNVVIWPYSEQAVKVEI